MKSLLTLLLVTCSLTAHAGGIDALHAFVAHSRTARAQFSQTVYDSHGAVRQRSDGTMEFSRPGRFRWVYRAPYEQVIIGDGKKIWLYDADLAQLTIRNLDKALGSSPAALLAGDNAIERYFTLADDGSRNGLDWLLATPREADSSFRSIRMGFNGDELIALDITDNFGGRTELRLQHIERNPTLPASDFRFTPPPGTDVLSDTP